MSKRRTFAIARFRAAVAVLDSDALRGPFRRSLRSMRRPEVLCSNQPDGRLAVADLPTHSPLVGFRKRHPVNLENLRLLESRDSGLDLRRQEQVQNLGEDSRRAQIAFQAVPLLGTHPRLLDELTLRRDERRLVGLQLPRRQLPDPSFRHVAILPEQAHAVLCIDGHHRGPARVVNDFQLSPIPIRQNHLVSGNRDDATTKLKRLLFRFHVGSQGVKALAYSTATASESQSNAAPLCVRAAHDDEYDERPGTLHEDVSDARIQSVARSLNTGTLMGVRRAHLILITGMPGTGKSTLAGSLARHLGVPRISKDTIKEPLLDVIGAADRAESRWLSDASFAVMFALARDCLRAGTDLILEGNFRAGEHEPALSALSNDVNATDASATDPGDGDSVTSVRITQILCHVPEHVRIARLKARSADPSRHPGHRDAALAVGRSPSAADFLALPSERFVFDSHADPAQLKALFKSIEQRHRDRPNA